MPVKFKQPLPLKEVKELCEAAPHCHNRHFCGLADMKQYCSIYNIIVNCIILPDEPDEIEKNYLDSLTKAHEKQNNET